MPKGSSRHKHITITPPAIKAVMKMMTASWTVKANSQKKKSTTEQVASSDRLPQGTAFFVSSSIVFSAVLAAGFLLPFTDSFEICLGALCGCCCYW